MQMLSPGKGETHRAYWRMYNAAQFAMPRTMVYDFAAGRAGEHAHAFLHDWCVASACVKTTKFKCSFDIDGFRRNHGAASRLRMNVAQAVPD
ncbi:hypothetical protein G0D91_16990 [Burkholderia multivorans]|nr:hypothetical protein [Burkholderia multivorans]MBN6733454.1 hypothetical protein [Burkholderia multivorans]MBN7130371.1 hypothetical protein [Burkholderia multivorans]MBN8165090.1 hypothetical protein [Burkholderia multivorans]MBN8170879.1 hypothetical protein [Burkholderia multivorans]